MDKEDIENLWLPKGNRGGGGINLKFGINRYILLYTKEINNKALLYSTENNIMEKNQKKNV